MKEIALVGNPNSGKTSVFNALTGLRHKTANYPGVTVEKRTGTFKLSQTGETVSALDLPGTYSLLPRSMDEEVVHNVLFGLQSGISRPDLVVVVVDATNFERNLYLATQVMGVGLPVVLALNMWDLAVRSGISIDRKRLEREVNCPCVETVGNRADGIGDLRRVIEEWLRKVPGPGDLPKIRMAYPDAVRKELEAIIPAFQNLCPIGNLDDESEVLRLLADTKMGSPFFRWASGGKALERTVAEARIRLVEKGIDYLSLEAEERYRFIDALCAKTVSRSNQQSPSLSERFDLVLTHPLWGILIFTGVMALLFQAIFFWAQAPMDGIAAAIHWAAEGAEKILPDGQLKNLMIDGILAGVGNVLVFLPQIFILFFFIGFFEDSGYMARAAFVLDRIMKKVGLNGKAFLPLLSSFACAVPGILSTRTIEDCKDRLATILVAPLMSCSARLPIYTLMIGAFIPAVGVFGIFNLKGIMLLCMYFLSILIGLGMAFVFRRSLLKGRSTPFVFELPPYRIPNLRNILLTVWDNGKEFLYRAGTIIFFASIILWFLVSYPKASAGPASMTAPKTVHSHSSAAGETAPVLPVSSSEAIAHSFAGRAGRFLEPVIQPLGFDWKIGVGIVASFAAREVFVSTLAIVYNIETEKDEGEVDLIRNMKSEVSPATGKPVYTPLVAVSLMVFYVLGCPCMSTLAVIKRETGGWGWPSFVLFYTNALAWAGAFITYQGGKLLGWGG